MTGWSCRAPRSRVNPARLSVARLCFVRKVIFKPSLDWLARSWHVRALQSHRGHRVRWDNVDRNPPPALRSTQPSPHLVTLDAPSVACQRGLSVLAAGPASSPHYSYRRPFCERPANVSRLGDDTTVFVFLPLAHALTRMAQMLTIDVGGTLAVWQGDKDKLIEDLRSVRPTHFPAVPRIFEKIYAQAKSRAGGTVKGKLLDKAIDVGLKVRELERHGEEPGPVLKGEFALADQQILSSVRDLFGGRVKLALTGAAPWVSRCPGPR
jgi:acyl-CoA synthetase (AMP-forming)/AMP-acid ligase II